MERKFEITIDGGSAPNRSVIVNVDDSKFQYQNTQDTVIREAVSQEAILTKDVRWIDEIKEIK